MPFEWDRDPRGFVQNQWRITAEFNKKVERAGREKRRRERERLGGIAEAVKSMEPNLPALMVAHPFVADLVRLYVRGRHPELTEFGVGEVIDVIRQAAPTDDPKA